MKTNLPLKLKTSLLLFLLLVLSQQLFAQALIDARLPAITTLGTSANRAPNGTSGHTTFRAHFLIPASEATAALSNGTIIKRLGFVLTSGVNSAASGQIKIYLENTSNTTNTKSTTWATAITGMSEVYNGVYNLPVGTSNEHELMLNLTNNFTYTGQGIYVAYDYIGSSFANTAAVYTSDQSIVGALFNGQSATTTPPATLTATSAFRPQMIFSYDNPFNNDIVVTAINRDFGYLNKFWLAQNSLTATVKNGSNVNKTNIPVQLTVTGANAQTQTVTIPSLVAGQSTTVNFTPSLINIGNQTFTISVPNDQNNTNNSKAIDQNISCDVIRYAGNETPFDGIGFNTGGGILAVKYTAPTAVKLSAVKVRLSSAASNVGKIVRGAFVDGDGNIVASSADFTITAGTNNTEITLPVLTPVTFNSGDVFYAGLVQTAATPGYFPVGTVAPQNAPADRYFSMPISGGTSGTITNYTDLGNLVIGAVVEAQVTLSASAAGIIQFGEAVSFTASSGFTNYNFKVNGISKQNSNSATFIYIPLNNDVVSLEATKDGCVASTNMTMQVTNVTATRGILFVKKGSTGDGSSWGAALGEFGHALAAAKAQNSASPGTVNQIWVAGGIYKPLYSPADNNFGIVAGRSNAFLMLKDVKLYGGFAGTETALAQRDLSINNHKSILSGDFNDDDVISGGGATLSFANNGENAHNVLLCVGDVGTATLDGFSISGGAGGGSNTTVNNLLVRKSDGGGMNILSSSPSITNCIFQYNSVQTGMGGALYIGKPNLGVTAAPIISNSNFFNNSSNNVSGQGWGDEGAGAMYIFSSSPIISDCSFIGNLVTGSRLGGAIVNASSATKFDNVVINSNVSLGTSASGGGLANLGTEVLTLNNVILSGNSAEANGGAIHNASGSAASLLNNVLISGNTANNGAGIYNFNTSPILTNVTISGNQAVGGAGLYNANGSLPQLQNTVVFGNSSGITNNTVADILVYRNSLVQGLSGVGLINFNGVASDLFVSPLAPSLATGGDYRPKSGSPMVNTGDQTLFLGLNATTKDLAGNARLMGGDIDLGPYEVQNDPPVIVISAGNTLYTNPNEVAVDDQITITDSDHSTLASATISINNNKQAQDILSFTNNGFGNISGAFNNGVLTLSSAGATATLLQWQNALRAVKFSTASLVSNGTRTIDFMVNDGIASSVTATKTITLGSATANLNCDAVTNQTNIANGICVGCSVTNSWGAVDTDAGTASTFNLPISILGANIEQMLIFPSLFLATDTVTVLLEGPPSLLPADIFAAIQIGSYDGATSNNDVVNLNNSSVKIKIIGNKVEVKFKPSQIYDRIMIRLNGGMVNGLNSLNIYYATNNVPPPVVSQSVVNICAGTPATLTANAKANAIVEWFDVPTGGVVLPNGQGNSFTTPSLSANKIYYAQAKRASNSCDNRQRIPVEVRIIAPPSITQEPINSTVNVGNNTSFSVTAAASLGTLTYQWQVDKGSGFEDLSNAGKYSNTNTATLQITGVDYSLNTYQYRCVVSLCAQTLNSAPATLSVNKLTQTLSFAQQTVGSTVNATYGDAIIDGSATSSASSLVLTYSSSNPLVATVANNGQVTILGKGTTVIKAIQLGNESYLPAQDIAFSLNVAPKALTITATGNSKVYDANIGATVSLSHNGITGDQLNVAYATANFGDKNVEINKAIAVSGITLTGTAAVNYTFNTTANASANITPFTLIISANASNKAYNGNADASVVLSHNGFAGDMLTLNYANATFNDQNVAVNKAVNVTGISVTGTDAGNYTFNTTASTTANITPVTLTIAAQVKAKTYGNLDPSLTYTSTGLIGADAISGTLVRDVGENVGAYAIRQGTLTAGANYIINYTLANLNIAAKAIAVTVDAKSKIYGDVDPAITFTATSLVGNDTFTGSPSRDAGENVGSYAIRQGSLSAGPNYNLIFTSANLSINKATLTVTAANNSRCFGQANPTLAVNYSGFKRNDNENSLNTKPQTTTTATTNSQAGNYAINVLGGVSDNYTFVYVNGNLNVYALPIITITPSKQGPIGKGLSLQLVATGGNNYSWANAQGIVSGQNGASLTVRPSTTTTYSVTVSNANGCSSTMSYTVNVADDLSILAATNIISPNGDGINDVWKVENIDMYPQSTVRIFDKAGRVLYTKKGYDNTWDGTYNGQALAENTYYYIIDIGEGKMLKGFITLVRESR